MLWTAPIASGRRIRRVDLQALDSAALSRRTPQADIRSVLWFAGKLPKIPQFLD